LITLLKRDVVKSTDNKKDKTPVGRNQRASPSQTTALD